MSGWGATEYRFAAGALREGGMMRVFSSAVAACLLGMMLVGVILWFNPMGPQGAAVRAGLAVAMVSALPVAWRWARAPWPGHRTAVAFVVWADCVMAFTAIAMATPPARLSATSYMGLIGVFVAFLLGRRLLLLHCGFGAMVIVGITLWAARTGQSEVFGLFGYYMPALTWVVLIPLGGLALIEGGRRAIRRTARSAHYDVLTGLRNRRGMYSVVHAAVRRRGAPVTVVMAVCDIDRFKELNDGHGHAAGDAALIEMAQRLKALARDDEITARTGGDELVLVAVLDDATAMDELLERLSSLTRVEVRGTALTASIGVASSSSADPHFAIDDVLRDADAAMYEAKRAGGARLRGGRYGVHHGRNGRPPSLPPSSSLTAST